MTLQHLSWYLCVLCVVALVAGSAMTVAPGGETVQRILLGTEAGLAILFAAVAVAPSRFHVRGPKWLLRVVQGFAILATLLVLMITVG